MLSPAVTMSDTKSQPGWIRLFRIIFGLVAIAASFFVLAEPGLGVFTLVLLLSFAMIMLGVARLARAFSHSLFSKGHRAFDAIVGILGIMLGLFVLADPLLGASTLVLLLAFATMIYGVGSIVIGAWVARLAKWVRALLLMIGLFAIVFAFIVLGDPALGIFTLVILLAVSLMVNGIESIVSAI
jgi:uncharacterized membrane protein HdeD (DUF308 family)